MKLRSFKELDNGIYKNIPIEETITARVWEMIHFVLFFVTIFISINFGLHRQIWLTAITISIYLIITFISLHVLRYCILCETYIGNKNSLEKFTAKQTG